MASHEVGDRGAHAYHAIAHERRAFGGANRGELLLELRIGQEPPGRIEQRVPYQLLRVGQVSFDVRAVHAAVAAGELRIGTRVEQRHLRPSTRLGATLSLSKGRRRQPAYAAARVSELRRGKPRR